MEAAQKKPSKQKHKIELTLWVEGLPQDRAELLADRLCKNITKKMPKGLWLTKRKS